MRVSSDTLAGRGAQPHAPAAGSSSISASPIDLIEVRAPYCALRDVRIPELGRALATVEPELELDMEVGAISAAEAGRHMAILGSIACATQARDPNRRSFYLAERAVLRAPDRSPSSSPSHPSLQLSARSVEHTPRSSQAQCEIRAADDTLLYSLDVGYKLVPEKVFQRLFSAFRIDMRRADRPAAPASNGQYQRRNPYRTRLPVTIEHLDARSLRSVLPNIPAEACAGHFPLYPALPVAVLMEVLASSAGTLLRSHRGEPNLRFRSIEADIVASRLAFAGQSLRIEGEVLEDISDTRVRVQMRALLSDGEEVSVACYVMEAAPSEVR